MKLAVLATGSSGNCYTLTSRTGEILIIEAGIRWRSMMQGIDYQLERVAGVIISHRHGDHAQSILRCQEAGLHTYTHPDVLEHKRKLIPHYSHALTPLEFARVGSYRVLPLEVHHDAPCFAFVVSHPELMGRIVFATDCVSFPYRVQDTSLLMVECNYDDSTLQWAIDHGQSPASERHRLECSHMELTQTIEAINLQKEVSPTTLAAALLIHTSSRHASPQEMIAQIERATGVPTYIATPGQTYEV